MTNLNAAVQTVPAQSAEIEQFSAFGSIQHFEAAQRMAKALCSSSIVPDTYRGEGKIGDCVIALEISNRIGMNVLAVMQNLYQVHGKPAWSSQFLIACVNASRRFSPMRYKMTGKKSDDTWGCIAWATDKSGEVLESPEVTIKMAKSEGWFQRNGSKWQTMPELMLHYRAATFFARLYAPELTMGIRTQDEVVDIETEVVKEAASPASVEKLFGKAPAKIIDATVVAPTTPEPATTAQQPPPPPAANEPIGISPAKEAQDAIMAAGVDLDGFVAEIKARNIALNSESWKSWQDVPLGVWETLAGQPKTVSKIVKTFGTNK